MPRFQPIATAVALLGALSLPVGIVRAGDILRGGSPLNTARRTATSGSNAGADAATIARTNARDRLARTTQALQSVQALQQAARNAAQSSRKGGRLADPNRPGRLLPGVRDGLGPRGLQVADGVPKNLRKPKAGEDAGLWIGANLPTETHSGGGVKVTITQQDQQALLNWKKFDIGKKTTLVFDQSKGGRDASKWIAFNKVNDPSGRPSQILGSIQADGQVYVINQNGIIFGGSSQVNTRSLTAAALPISDNLISKGLLDNPSGEFLFDYQRSENLLSTLSATNPSATFSAILSPDTTPQIQVSVRKSAKLSELTLVAGEDYTLSVGKDRRTTLTLTAAGIAKAFPTGVGYSTERFVATFGALTGNIDVQRGAQLTSPTSAEKVGGRIVLAGANVKNRGTIETPDGQTILAAGLQIGFQAHSGDDPSLRGLDTYIGAVADPTSTAPKAAGHARNAGLIDAQRGDIMLAGSRVRQDGFLDSTTSVELNGRIDLLANYDALGNPAFQEGSSTATGKLFVPRSTGVVSLGRDSVMRILPEYGSDATRIGTTLALPSQVQIKAGAVHFGRDTVLQAPNAKVAVEAGEWLYTPPATASASPQSQFVYTNGQIYADPGALIDVSGTPDAFAPLAENILTVGLRGAEFADSPLQRNGAFRASDANQVEVTVDLRKTGTFNGRDWIGTPLADVTGFANIIERSVAELTKDGGSVTLNAGNSVVLRRGSTIDVSGGYLNYEGGFVETTQVAAGNQLIDIADATPDLVYDGVYTAKFTDTHPKWGVAATYRNPLALSSRHFESSYVSGGAGGSISIKAPSMAVDGDLRGNTVAGPRQLRDSSGRTNLPATSRLSLEFSGDQLIDVAGTIQAQIAELHPPKVIFDPSISQADPADFALDDLGKPLEIDRPRRNKVVLSSDLVNDDGFGSLTVANVEGSVVVNPDASMTTTPGGLIDFEASRIDIRGDLTAPGGDLSFTAYQVSPYEFKRLQNYLTPDAGPDYKFTLRLPGMRAQAGRFFLRSGAELNTAGLLVDQRFSAGDPFDQLLQRDGGAVTIAAYEAALAEGSVVDVSGGVELSPTGKVSYGDAGSITVLAGRDPGKRGAEIGSYQGGTESITGGKLTLAGDLRGYSGATGGSLTVQAMRVRVASAADRNSGTFDVTPDFFNRGGFTSFSLVGIGAKPVRANPFLDGKPLSPSVAYRDISENRFAPGVTIEPNLWIKPQVQSWVARPVGSAGLTLETTRLPEGLRAPVSLAFKARGSGDYLNVKQFVRGDLEMGAGSLLQAGPRGSVTLAGDTVSVLGSVDAPGGSITVTGRGSWPDVVEGEVTDTAARATVYVGPESRLNAAGTVLPVPDPFGYRKGTVLPGGQITLTGNVIAEPGSLLDVSGTSGILDLAPSQVDLAAEVVPVTSGLTRQLFSRTVVATPVDSDAGSITLTGGEMLFVGSQLRGNAGGPTAQGGSLSVSSGRFYDPGAEVLPTDITLTVRQGGSFLPDFVSGRGLLPDAGGPLTPAPMAADRGVGSKVFRSDGTLVPAQGYFTADSFIAGGFDSLELGGNVRFSGPVTIDARQSLTVATDGIISADSAVKLRAPYVALGRPFTGPLRPEDPRITDPFQANRPFYFGLRRGTGSLTVVARLIDIGNLAVRGVHRTNLFADGGDIRGQGEFAVPGELNIRAGQIYPVSGGTFTLAAFDYRLAPLVPDPKKPYTASQLRIRPGSITIAASGDRPLPLSAGGELNLYASEIVQGGVLRAPLGTINLGWDGTGDAPTSTLVGANSKRLGQPKASDVPVTRRLFLAPGSETSVSAVGNDGNALVIPYGIVTNSDSWIDPRGIDISVSGVPTKSIHLGAKRLNAGPGSVVDVSGGGDLFAYRWVPGQGGSRDLLASSDSFAVLPTYGSDFAPVAPFNQTTDAQTTFDPTFASGDTPMAGYANAGLRVGDRVRLGGGGGLAAGDYTLLPARYALLPGAFLVTPESGSAVGSLGMPDGSSLVSGYRFNSLNPASRDGGLLTRFEVASGSVVGARADYEVFSANRFLRQKAREVEAAVPRLPRDAGRIVFQAQDNLRLNSTVLSLPQEGGRGASIDISTPRDILIVDRAPASRPENTIVLSAGRLSALQAESLLIGGVRSDPGATGTPLTVATGNITLQNSHNALQGPEIILASRDSLTLKPGAKVAQTGVMAGDAERLLVEGDGLLLRVSSDPTASIARSGFTPSGTPVMTIGGGASITGTSLILDSSAATSLSPGAHLLGDYVTLDSGQITLKLNEFGIGPDTTGLVLAGTALHDLQGVAGLKLLSYSSIDIVGGGRFTIDGALELHAGEIRGFGQGTGKAAFEAGSIVIDNTGGATRPGRSAGTSGQLSFTANTIELGRGRLDIDQYDAVSLNATAGLRFAGDAHLRIQGDLLVRTPQVTGDSATTSVVRAGGQVQLLATAAPADPPFRPGVGASLSIEGTSMTVTSNILLPSGVLSLRATEGDVNVGGNLDVGGAALATFDRITYTSGGQITLDAAAGDVKVAKTATLSLAAQPQAGDAGTLAIRAPQGDVALDGTLLGTGGKRGASGSFLLDVKEAARLTALNTLLDAAGFFERRSFRVREGDVVLGGTTRARRFDLSADSGSITITGRIDASGDTGGLIRLQAYGDLVLANGSELTVAGANFNAAGKGGSILLEAGSEQNGQVGPGTLQILDGSQLDLSVATANASSESVGQFEGILHLRAPRNAGNNDVQIAPIAGLIKGASHILVEGYQLYDLNAALDADSPGTITTAVRKQIKDDAIAFLGDAGVASAGYDAMLARLLSEKPDLASILSIRPGAEIINRNGDLTLGDEGSPASDDWNLASYRFGPKSAPGVLTLRASGDLVFYNALQDGFAVDDNRPALSFLAPLLDPNPALPANSQSWSLRLTAGGDLTAADFAQLLPRSSLGKDVGSVRIGKEGPKGGVSNPSGNFAVTLSAILGITSQSANPASISNFVAKNAQSLYQVIRTGSGDIEISAGRDVQLMNQFATIYTAGTLVEDPTLGGTFQLPQLGFSANGSGLGNVVLSPAYPVQYSLGGGDVSVFAGSDIAHYIPTTFGHVADDSSRQLPMNWLYRRGYVDPQTGEFGASSKGEIASTTWWIDFSNFFEGIGALGGGNVNLVAGRDVKNVDAVVPTNARMPAGAPNADNLVELGGGDLVVRAGRDLDGGVYYVERGNGTLAAGDSIVTNSSRSPSQTILTASDPLPEQTWLPTTLFLGKGRFDVSARGDILLGPAANPFLLPGGINNAPRYKTYFSTYAPSDSIDVLSLGGAVTLRTESVIKGGGAEPLLYQWLDHVLRFDFSNPSYSQPWLRLDETDVTSFKGVAQLMPGSLRIAAPSGDVNFVGNVTLSPASKGTLDVLAGGSINGLQPNGVNSLNLTTWYSAQINVSDASPASIPGIASPFAFQTLVANETTARRSGTDFLNFIDILFEETGAVDTVLATKQALHSANLHADDSEPLRLYAANGSISGLTLFSPKQARVIAHKDITDISFYIQNLTADDITTIAAGRNLTAYNANSPLRSAAYAPGNIIAGSVLDQAPQAGDIQISGPGTLEVLAGRNLDLGTGASNANGTAAGITTIGNRRNPYLPFDGADIVVAAGIGPATSLFDSALDFTNFLATYSNDPRFAEILAEMSVSTPGAPALTLEDLTPAQQARAAIRFLFTALSDTAHDRADPTSPNFGLSSAYDPGYTAIADLFNARKWRGDVLAQGRDIRTRNGGNIDILVPGGSLRLADVVIGNPEIPPGVITETGGSIDILTDQNVNLGVGRIFTLRGGDLVIWSSTGDIAAGAASRTVASAPPARVILDPQSAALETDLAGLSTGGGIGALATVAGVAPSNIDLIAPVGTVDAGDAGIRASGNITIAAETVLNASNIAAGGTVAGPAPAAPAAAPNVAGLTAASNTAGAANSAANDVANQARQQTAPDETPSVITVEVLGYGGEDDSASTAPAGGGA
jgi:filamentous hemagglutinin family protein